jgi:hypothetical protein
MCFLLPNSVTNVSREELSKLASEPIFLGERPALSFLNKEILHIAWVLPITKTFSWILKTHEELHAQYYARGKVDWAYTNVSSLFIRN